MFVDKSIILLTSKFLEYCAIEFCNATFSQRFSKYIQNVSKNNTCKQKLAFIDAQIDAQKGLDIPRQPKETLIKTVAKELRLSGPAMLIYDDITFQ